MESELQHRQHEQQQQDERESRAPRRGVGKGRQSGDIPQIKKHGIKPHNEGETMVTFEELMEEYWICRRGKRTSYDMSTLEMEWMQKLLKLRDGINARRWKPGQSACFVLTFPVPREVVAAENIDRVVHQYIDSRLRPLLEEKVFHPRAFSCIKGKGTLYGAIVSALIRAEYPTDRMEAVQNNWMADPTNDAAVEEMLEMQQWRAAAKILAREAIRYVARINGKEPPPLPKDEEINGWRT